jgi:O-acetyl-ADP-ribose deacetylase (regulator of RNase III)
MLLLHLCTNRGHANSKKRKYSGKTKYLLYLITTKRDMIIHTTGNILQSNAQALVNPVNCVGVMGKGLALQFKRAFPSYFRCYKDACRKNLVRPGKMYVHLHDQPPYTIIISFPTKTHYKQPSVYGYISDGLTDLVNVIQERSIKSIAIPALGCGNGGLVWETIKHYIEKKMEPLEGVDIYVYNPQK